MQQGDPLGAVALSEVYLYKNLLPTNYLRNDQETSSFYQVEE
jgi:hypothetical protein